MSGRLSSHALAWLVAAIAAAVLPAQVTATLKPISLVTTKQVLGDGRKAGLWTVQLCNDSPAKLVVDRARVSAAAPGLHDLPNALAEDIVGRQTAGSARSLIGNNADTVLGFASQGLALAGLATGTDAATYGGLGLAGAQWLARAIGSRAPTAQPYFSQLLPDQVPLSGGACSQTFYLFASLMKGAATIQVKIAVPGGAFN